MAIKLVCSTNKGNYCIVYDLKDGKIWKKFELKGQLEDMKNWVNIFEFLTKECPPDIVNACYAVEEKGDFIDWLLDVKMIVNDFGCGNLSWTWFCCMFHNRITFDQGKRKEIQNWWLCHHWKVFKFTLWSNSFIKETKNWMGCRRWNNHAVYRFVFSSHWRFS